MFVRSLIIKLNKITKEEENPFNHMMHLLTLKRFLTNLFPRHCSYFLNLYRPNLYTLCGHTQCWHGMTNSLTITKKIFLTSYHVPQRFYHKFLIKNQNFTMSFFSFTTDYHVQNSIKLVKNLQNFG